LGGQGLTSYETVNRFTNEVLKTAVGVETISNGCILLVMFCDSPRAEMPVTTHPKQKFNKYNPGDLDPRNFCHVYMLLSIAPLHYL